MMNKLTRYPRSMTIEMMKMYDAGMTQLEIANALGCSQRTVSCRLDGYGAHRRGGVVASTIPEHEFKAATPTNHEESEMQAISEKNATNACLVVSSKDIDLEGSVGKYHVSGKDQAVYVSVGDSEIKLHFDSVIGFIDELKAIARNIETVKTGCEMW